MTVGRTATLALLLLAAGCVAPPVSVTALRAAPDGPAAARDRVVSVPVTDEQGVVTNLQTRLCRSDATSGTPAPLVVINHGAPPNASARPRMQLRSCGEEATQWFLRRGYVVAFPLRRGYGATGGPAAEASPNCNETDDVRSGLETARDIAAVVDALTTLPFIRPDRVVVVGQSAGGWGSVAYDSVPHPKVAALVSMAGGRGGHFHMRPNENCHPDRLIEAAGHFGATASTPMLWIYTANDSYFAPPLAAALDQAFTAAGGRAQFERLGPFGADGHALFFAPGGSAVWGPLIEGYLAQQKALP